MNGASGFTTVFVSGNYNEACMVASVLDGHEIESIVIDDEVCRVLPGVAFIVGGAKVLVAVDDKELAEDLIALVYQGGAPYVGSFANVGVGGSDIGVFLAIPWMLRRSRRLRTVIGDNDEATTA